MGTYVHWREAAKTLCKTLGVGVGFVLMAITLLTLANALPTGRMAAHVSESMPMYLHEGDRPSETPGSPGSIRDNFTEAIMLNMAVYPSSSKPFENALSSHLLPGDPSASADTARVVKLGYVLENRTNPEFVAKADTYTRYWHGYLVLLKPLLLFLNPAEIRYLNLVCQLALVSLTCVLIYRVLSPKTVLAFLGTYALLNPVTTALNFQFYSVFYCAVLGTLTILVCHQYFQKHRLWPAFFLLLGMSVSFLDFLTYPVLALGIPLVAYVMVCKESNLLKVIGNSIVWAVGYVGFWSLKWILAAIFAGQPLSSVKKYILFRLDSSGRGAELASQNAFSRFDGVKDNLDQITQSSSAIAVFLISALVLLMLLLLRIVRFECSTAFTKRDNLAIAVVAIYPFIWYLMVLNHSVIHSWFTYRDLGVTIFALLLLLLQFITLGSRAEYLEDVYSREEKSLSITYR